LRARKPYPSISEKKERKKEKKKKKNPLRKQFGVSCKT
jgi:hypothetical protein